MKKTKQEYFYYDHGYKFLFSSNTFVRYLIIRFVKGAWREHIDFSTLEKLGNEIIGEEWDKRELDILYKVRYKGREAYILLLIEFQSTVDNFMALRMLHYVTKIYMDIKAQKKKQKISFKTFPPIFPIVLHSGGRKWTAPLEFAELIKDGEGDVKDIIPKFHYVKIGVRDYPREELLQNKDLVSALFYLETAPPDELEEAIRKVLDIIIDEPDKEAMDRFLTWVNRLVRREAFNNPKVEKFSIHRREEITTMIQDTFAKRDKLMKGKGRKEGIKEDLVASIISYLQTKFSIRLGEEAIKNRSSEKLEALRDALYKCGSPEEAQKILGEE